MVTKKSYTTDSITPKDSTRIDYRKMASVQGIILLHGV